MVLARITRTQWWKPAASKVRSENTWSKLIRLRDVSVEELQVPQAEMLPDHEKMNSLTFGNQDVFASRALHREGTSKAGGVLDFGVTIDR
jgi:hypothetical protein